MLRMLFLCTILSQFPLSGRKIFPTNQARNLDRVRPLLKFADAHIARSDLTEALSPVIQAEAIASMVEAVQLKRASPTVSLAYAKFLKAIGAWSSTGGNCFYL